VRSTHGEIRQAPAGMGMVPPESRITTRRERRRAAPAESPEKTIDEAGIGV